MSASEQANTSPESSPEPMPESVAERRLGIMGGGQLGMLLCEAARPLGITTAVLEPNPAGSALPFADTPIVAALDDLEAVQALIDASDVITFELEAIPDESLALLREAEASGDLAVRPSIDTLMRFKDKGVQKAWLDAEGLPTLPSITVEAGQPPAALLDGSWSLPVVQKAHRGGYDGKGVQVLRTKADLERLWPVPSYLEPALTPVRELSVVICRALDGTMAAYPPVSMTFDERYNAVHSVTSPANTAPELVKEATRITREAIGRLDTPGVFAVELFVDPEDRITVNEISPRVHNSGHLTLEAFDVSQFHQHVAAVMGLPVKQPEPLAPHAEMLNILYDPAFKAACPPKPAVHEGEGDAPCTVYWYGKSTGQAGRKMGHMTAVGAARDAVSKSAEHCLANLAESTPGAASESTLPDRSTDNKHTTETTTS